MDQLMNELLAYGPVSFLWSVRLLWLAIGSIGVFESAREYFFNLGRYRRYLHAGNSKEIIARGRHWRSFWFLLAFFVCFITGVLAVTFLFVQAPPRPDISVQSATLTLLLEVMIIFFWLAKHADRRAARETEAYARSYQSVEDGHLLGEQPDRPHGA